MSLFDATSASSATGTVLEGTLDKVVFSNEENAWSVVRIAAPGHREPVTAVGNLLGVQPGENLRLEGEWIEDPRWGRQFKVASYRTVAPSTRAGIERYLGSGLVPGIRKRLAKRLVAHFGLETLTVIEHQPERLAEVPGFGSKRRAEVQRALLEQREAQEVMVFLQSHGVSTAYAVRIVKRYGSEALRVVRENPFRLAMDVHGIGFRSADRIAASLGIARDAPQRIEAGVVHLLGEGADRGHLFVPRARLLALGAELLGVAAEPVGLAVEALAAAGDVVLDEIPAALPALDREQESPLPEEGPAVYLAPLHAAEAGLAARLRSLLAQPALPFAIDVERALQWFAARERIALAPGQREAIARGLTSKLLVITGGPGTGKTTLVRGIVEILQKKDRTVLLAAPTGRAAKRLSEATGGEAATLHRLLEFNPRTKSFDRNRDRPLACDLLIVDEVSMLDSVLAHHLFKAVPNGGRVVLVGDVDQLPSVGPGRVLGDLIRSRQVDVVRLTEIFRQAERSLIVVNAHRVQRGEMPLPGGKDRSKEGDADFFFIERRRPEEVLETIVQLVARRIPDGFGLDPIEQIQVLTPMNRGLLGTENLNAALREQLNPGGEPVGRGVLRVGDKVMQIRNNYDLEVWNGDLGRVEGVQETDDVEQVRVSIDGRPVLYEPAALDELVLAYACTIHKSQGSEYPCVVIPLHSQHHIMLQRNLLYTALTRARKLAIVVGEGRAVAAAVGNYRTAARFTLLAERLGGR
jgi:exodeoxyribonuclease V alpha subunit